VLGGVGLGSSVFCRPARLCEGRPALAAELLRRRIRRPARWTTGGQPSSAFAAELLARGILVLAPGTLHTAPSQRIGAGNSRTGGESLCWGPGGVKERAGMSPAG
jgi:hypothetical protein